MFLEIRPYNCLMIVPSSEKSTKTSEQADGKKSEPANAPKARLVFFCCLVKSSQ